MAGFFSRIFGTKKEAGAAVAPASALLADMHSHVLPGLDDGAETIEQSVALMQSLYHLGYRTLVMTPHIMGDFYKNTPEGINGKLTLVKEAAKTHGINLQLECAAEYYLDEWFTARLDRREQLLTFGGEKKYLLFETSYLNRPIQLNEAVFMIKSAGYTPVLAHPERYTYLYQEFNKLPELREKGVLMQVNINSLGGYYSAAAQKVAEKLIDQKLVDFAGTDAHNLKHLNALKKAHASKYYQKLLQLPLLNNTL